MFEENKVLMMALGTMHTVCLTRDGTDAEVPRLNFTGAPAQAEV